MTDEWDPVQRMSVAEKGVVGTQCIWTSPEPSACKLCYLKPISMKNPACLECFAQRHIYAHYLHIDVPGPRAKCAPLPSWSPLLAVNEMIGLDEDVVESEIVGEGRIRKSGAAVAALD